MNTKNPVLTVLTIAVLLFLNLGLSSASASPTIAQTHSKILFVKPGEAGDCYSWDTACDLQAALALAEAGDQVWVAAGTYKPTTGSDRTATFLLESGVAIYGGFAGTETSLAERDWETNLTTLSGDIGTEAVNTDNSYHVVTGNGASETTVLDGFIISGGYANGSSPNNDGGGMHNTNSSSPKLTNVVFSGNTASHVGGGMYNYGGSANLTNVLFSENTASNYGGGMRNNFGSLTLTKVTFSGNSAGFGGGLSNAGGNLKLTDVLFSGNTATTTGGGMEDISSSTELINVTFSGNTSGSNGGGMNVNSGSPTLINVTFSDNISASGGGLRSDGSSPTLINVTFSNNTATIGGGMSTTSNSSSSLTNVTFSENSATSKGGGMYNNFSYASLKNVTFSANTSNDLGGGMYNYQSNPTLTNITFSENTAIAINGGGGIYNDGVSSNGSHPVVVNSILWANTPDQISNDDWSSANVTYSIIQGGGFAGEGNIDLDPDLGDLADNGGSTQTYGLGAGSPAIDAGEPNTLATDQRGFYRPIDGDGDGSPICDMGAFEYGSFLRLFPLTIDQSGNGVVATDPDQTQFALYEIVTLTASADPDWDFTNWSGDADSTDNPLIITILGETNITANFEQVIFKSYLPLIVR